MYEEEEEGEENGIGMGDVVLDVEGIGDTDKKFEFREGEVEGDPTDELVADELVEDEEEEDEEDDEEEEDDDEKIPNFFGSIQNSKEI